MFFSVIMRYLICYFALFFFLFIYLKSRATKNINKENLLCEIELCVKCKI